MREVMLSKEGYQKLQEELEELRTKGRSEIAAEIKTAREFGDISENAEYDSAKNAQALLEKRISDLEERLSRAKILTSDERKTEAGNPVIGSTVNFKLLSGPQKGSSRKMLLCSSLESDASKDKLSIDSPIGMALSRARVGQTVGAITPRGEIKVKLTKIS